jgi:hypothetical protein
MILRDNPLAFKGLEKMINPYLAQKKPLKQKTPVGG